jgi:predicted nucleotidyltransferase
MKIEPVLEILDRVGARYALIGGHAVAARGYARATVDIDLLTTDIRVLTPGMWNDLMGQGAVIDCRRGDDDDPLAGVVHVQLPDDTDVDIVVGRWKWEEAIIERAEPMRIGGVEVRVPLASDLILLKLAAGGILDLRDAAALLAIGDRDALIRDVEDHLPEVRPDVTAAWRDVLAIEL